MLIPSVASRRHPNISQFVFILISLTLALWLGPAVEAFAQVQRAAAQPASYAATGPMGGVRVAGYGELPLAFEANRGQTDTSVRFLARGDRYSVFLTRSAAVLVPRNRSHCMAAKAHSKIGSEACLAESDMVRMELAGAAIGSQAKDRQVVGEDELPGKVNYFIGNDPAKWHTGLTTYGRVRYSGVYPGVDLVFYGNQRQLEYDFVVAPGASPAYIRLRFSRAAQPRIGPAGDLSIKGAYGEIVFHRPLIYQQDKDGSRLPVAGQFKLVAKNAIGFSLGGYDHTRPLIIDPVLIYSTYLGGNGGDQGNGIAVDDEGCAYVVGTTSSADFPVTRKTYQSNLSSGGSSVFISKLDPAGRNLIYSTYLGGSNAGSIGNAIALDEQGNAYVTGATYASDFPVTPGAFQGTDPSTTHGAPTGFVARLDRWGDALDYSTYLGGSGLVNFGQGEGDEGQGIAVDRRGNAYVTGSTASSNFPVTKGAFQTDFTGTDGFFKETFVTRLDPDGKAPVYSTFVGGSDFNFFNAIAIDDREHAFVAANGSVVKLNREGSGELYSASLSGGSAFAIAVDRRGFAYVAGNTSQPGPTATSGALEGTDAELAVLNAGGPIGFVSKLDRDGSEFEFWTYLEGVNTVPTGVAADDRGSVYVVGSAPAASSGGLAGFQATPDALPAPASTGNAAFLVKLDRNAAALNYATLLGGSTNDSANALALDSEGNVYLTGATSSTNFPVTEDAFQKMNNDTATGGSNAFISKFALQRKDDQVSYSLVPNGLLPTTITVTGTSITCNPYYFSFTIEFNVTADEKAPPPFGAVVYLTSPDIIYFPGIVTQPAAGGWGTTLPQKISYTVQDPLPAGATSFPWTVAFTGDSFRLASSLSGSTPCP